MSRGEFSAAGATDGLWAGDGQELLLPGQMWREGQPAGPGAPVSGTAGLLGPVSREHGPAWPTEPSWRHVPVATTSSGDACVNGVESVSRDLENLSCNLKPSPPVSFPWILPSPINLAFLLLPHLLGREEGTVTEGSPCSGQTPPGTSEPRTEALWAEAPPTPAPPPLTPGTEPWPFPHSSPRPTHPPGGAPSHPQGAAPALRLLCSSRGDSELAGRKAMPLPPRLWGQCGCVRLRDPQHRVRVWLPGTAVGAQDPHVAGLGEAGGDQEALWAQRPSGLAWPCLRPVHVPPLPPGRA